MFFEFRLWIFWLLLFPSFYCHAQVEDDFSDGDLSVYPAWSDPNNHFIVNDGLQLQLNNTSAAGSGAFYSHISTPFENLGNTSWEFSVALNLSPSGSNFIRVYLASNSDVLTGDLNGYFVLVGGTTDEISLHRQTGSIVESIITGVAKSVDMDPVNVRIKVRRFSDGTWELWRDTEGGENFFFEGTANDLTHTSSDHFGFYVRYSSGNKSNYSFDDISVYEMLEIESVSIINKNLIHLGFNLPIEEVSSSVINNYTISNGIEVLGASRSAELNSVIELTTSTLISGEYDLFVNNLADDTYSRVSGELQVEFSYTELSLEQIITPEPYEIRLLFNDDIRDDLTTTDFFIDNGVGNPATVQLDPSNPREVILTLEEALFEQPYSLSFAGDIFNISGNSQINQGTSFEFEFEIPLVAESLEVTDKNSLLLKFNKTLEPSAAENPLNYEVSPAIGTPIGYPFSASYSESGKSVVLTFDEAFEADTYSLTVTSLTSGGDTALQPDPTILEFSYLPLEVVSASASGENTLQITFNQELDPSSVQLATNYFLNDNFGNPVAAVLSESDASQVELTFAESFFNFTYELTINGVENAAGNAISTNLAIDVPVSKLTAAGALTITEILADPNPKGIAPELSVLPTTSTAEFVEVFNTTAHSISLNGFVLSGGHIGDVQIAPLGYLALVPEAHLSEFLAIGNSAEVSAWNTLTNSGEQIVLADQHGNTIDEVTFSSNWYGDPEKNGGWSLEKINPVPACESEANWTASMDSKGATPGMQNSVFDDTPDTRAPEVVNVEVIDQEILRLHFSEKMDAASLVAGNIVLDGYNVLTQVVYGERAVELQLDKPLLSEMEYVFEVSGFADCAGNAMIPASIPLYYDKKGPVLERLVVRSFSSLLLLFDEPLNELAAETEQNYELSNAIGVPSSATLSENLSQVLLKFDNELEVGLSYELFVSAVLDTLGNEMLTEPAFDFEVEQQIDSVWVEGPSSITIRFLEDVDPLQLAETTNFLLVDKLPYVAIPKSSKETALVFSENFAENKEMVLSISNLTGMEGNYLITPDYLIQYDTRAPTVETLDVLNQSQLLISYNEQVTASSAEIITNYTLNDTLSPSVAAYHPGERQVLLTFGEPFPLEVLSELKILHVSDLFKNVIKTSLKRSFVYDTLAPRVSNVVVTGPLNLQIEFSEPIPAATGTQLENFQLDGMLPVSATRHMPDSFRVTLTFSTPIPSSGELRLNNIADFYGNTASNILYPLSNEALMLATVTARSENILEVCFNKALAGFGTENVNAYPLAISGLSMGEETNCLMITLNDRMDDGAAYTLIFDGLSPPSGEEMLEPDSITFIYHSYVEKLVSNNSTTAELFLMVPAHPDSLQKATFRVMPGFLQPTAVLADSKNSSLVRLYFDTELPPDQLVELEMGGMFDEWSRKIPDQLISFSIDASRPEVDSIYTRLFNELVVNFSEPVSSLTGLAPNHYHLMGEGTPEDVQFVSGSDTFIQLFFENDFVDGQIYQLAVQRVEDLAGNVIERDTISFTFQPPPVPTAGELLITEIMADPTPAAGLPEAEYVEIYNRSSAVVDLSTVRFSDDAKSFELSGMLEAGEYLILCELQDAVALGAYGKVLGISGWSSLSNTGDSLSLVNIFGEIVDQDVYSDSWYKDISRDDGGFSLERIFAEPVCDSSLNWTASLGEMGGTPGGENSVWNKPTDTDAPLLNSVEIISANELQFSFNEILHPTTADPAYFQFTPQLTITSVEIIQPSTLHITLTEALSTSEVYSVSVAGILDCFNNESVPMPVIFALGEAVTPGDIIFSEIMADPSPVVGLPDAEYVEIFNRSDKLINLQLLFLEDEGASNPLNGFIGPGEYRLISSTTNQELFDVPNVIALSSFPSITNSGELLTLRDTSGNVVDEIDFNLSWYGDGAKDDGGYSLERIFTDPVCSPELNWAASAHEKGGTPGSQNTNWNSPADEKGPFLQEVSIQSATQVLVSLNEQVNLATVDATSFHFSPETAVKSVDVEGLQIQLTLVEELNSSIFYSLSCMGIEDCFGNLITDSPVTFALGELVASGDLVFSEIMADPTPVVGLPEAEYVEIYNRSAKLINLQQLVFADEGASINLTGYIGPGEYLLLTSPATQSFFESANILALSSFPSLTNSGEVLSLKDTAGNVIDQVAFDLSWYKDSFKDDGGYSLERINLGLICSGSANWTSAISPLGGTPGLLNSVNNNAPDKTPPALLDVKVQSNDALLLLFSKGIDAGKLESATVSIIGGPAIASIKVDDVLREQLTVVLTEPLVHGQAYLLQVSGISDCEGNVLAEATMQFGVGRSPEFGELLISEIMADPEPAVGLPEAEYMEVYNASADWLNLEFVRLETGTKSVLMPAATLAPASHLIITTAASAGQFNQLGKVLGMPDFPGLKNDGDDLALYYNEQIIHAASYRAGLFGSSAKAAGGWALELIDTSIPCAGEENWAASQASAGGTPGQTNSVSATLGDGFGPALREVNVDNDSTLTLRLSEKLRLDELTLTAEIVPQIVVNQLRYAQPVSDLVYVDLETKPEANTFYTIGIQGLVDCQGNLPAPEQTSATFILPAEADSLDLVINELLFNPRSGGVDFVEIYNNSDKFIDLKGWQLGNVSSSTGKEGNFISITDESLLIPPAGYRVFTESPLILKADYPSGKEEFFNELRLPSYPNTEGGVVMLNGAGKRMDRFNYSEDDHLPFLREVKGVSLERVSPAIASNEASNWHSATSAAGFATPGYQNSTARSATETQTLLLAEPRTIIGGEGSVYFYFDSTLSNTRLSAQIYDLNGRSVKTLLNGETVGQGGFVSWDGASDNGELVRVGIYIVQLEFFNVAGQQEVIRTTVAVGGRF